MAWDEGSMHSEGGNAGPTHPHFPELPVAQLLQQLQGLAGDLPHVFGFDRQVGQLWGPFGARHGQAAAQPGRPLCAPRGQASARRGGIRAIAPHPRRAALTPVTCMGCSPHRASPASLPTPPTPTQTWGPFTCSGEVGCSFSTEHCAHLGVPLLLQLHPVSQPAGGPITPSSPPPTPPHLHIPM